MTSPCSFRPVLRVLPAVLLLGLLCLALPALARAAGEPVAAENAAGSRDTLGLVNLGDGRSAIETFVTAGGTLTRERSWAGSLVFSRAKFAAGDVNGDGLADGIVLYDLRNRRTCIYVFLSDGTRLGKKRLAWKSAKGVPYVWARTKLTVGDVNADGKDDILVLYNRGSGRAELQRFVSKGATFKMSVAWRCGRGRLYASRAKLAAGDANGDGPADAIVLYRGSPSRLLVFTGGGTRSTKKTFWKGDYPAGVKLAAGDLDSDGDVDAVALRDNGDGRVALDAFVSDKAAFAAPAVWWLSQAGTVARTARLACGDTDADGMADAVLLTPIDTGSFAAVCSSTGTGFEPGPWWSGSATAASTRLACAPGAPVLLREKTVVLSDEALAALQQVDAAAAVYTFASGVPEVDGLAVDDVIAFQPCEPLPYGALRKVTSVVADAGLTVVTTVQATLEEAVKEGELAIDETCTQDDIAGVVESKPGVRLVQHLDAHDRSLARRHRASIGGEWVIAYDVTLEDLVTLSGELRFKQTFDLTSSWGVTRYALGFIPVYGMKSIRFTSETVQTTSVDATLEASVEDEVETDLATYTMRTFVVWFGPVPVTFTPEVTLYVGASGEFAVGVTTGFETVTTVTTGLQWRRGQGWSTIAGFTNTRTFTPPHLYGRLALRAYAGLEAMLKIYYLAGPTAGIEAYLGLNADTDKVPWWKLVVGLDATVGFKVDVIDYEEQANINLFEKTLLTADGGYKAKGTLSGAVLAAEWAVPLADAVVELHEGAASPGGALVATTTSGADGSYGFADLDEGSYTVTAAKTGFAAGERAVAVTGGAATTGQDVELAVEGGPGIGGTVAQNGDPVGDVTVELRQGWDDPAGPLVATVVTTYSGEYRFDDLPAGDYTVVASRTAYFTKRISVTVGATFVPFQDIALHDLSEQGVSGYIFDGPDGSAVYEATVTLHEGYHDPDGPVVDQVTAESNSWQFEHVAADQYSDGRSDYTVVATKDGYARGIEEVIVYEGQWTNEVTLILGATDGVSPGTASTDDSIDWPGEGVDNADATYELWFKPSSTDPGRIAAITFWYWNYPGPIWEVAPTMTIDYTAANTVAFAVNQSAGDTPGDGTWHQIVSETQVEVGQWHHIAAQNGSQGLRLYIDGHLEAYQAYTGKPEADHAGALPTDGRFCLGDTTWWDAEPTAQGQYKWLRVSSVQRHYMNFTPPETLVWDGSTDVLDPLLGGTNGWNSGFTWEP